MKNTKAVVYTKGRLGNQLFQYFFGYKLLKEGIVGEIAVNNSKGDKSLYINQLIDIIIDEKKFRDNLSIIQRLFFIAHKKKIISNESLPYLYKISKYGFVCYNGFEDIDFNKLKIKTKKAIVCGFFENHTYYDYIRNNIINCFSFHPSYSSDYSLLLKRIKGNNSVCISVRRGDFLERDDLNICGFDYFSRAIKIIKEKVSNPCFIVFSDDVAWCKKQYIFKDFLFENDNNTLSNKLFVMSKCSNFILSNSTFSFWSCFLSGAFNGKNGIVVSPSSWSRIEEKTKLIYEDWITIKI